MKQYLLSIIFLTLTFSYISAQEQKTTYGIKTGLNVSILSASINSEASWKSGFHIGFYMKNAMSEKTFFRPELYFSSQGQKDNYIQLPGGSSVGETTTSLNYLNLPILFEFGKKVSFQVGPQVGVLISAKEEGTIQGQKVNDDLKTVMKSSDFGLVFGSGIQLSDHVNFGARLNLGLSDIFESGGNGDSFSVKNRTLHFYLGIGF